MLAGDAGAAMATAAETGSIETASSVQQADDHTRHAAADSGQPIVFVDSAVENASDLLREIPGDSEVVLLSPDFSGLTQINQVLRGRVGVRSVHIISHGDEGSLQLGNQLVDQQTLVDNASQFDIWRDALSSDADILLYGCRVAAGADGEQFVLELADLTAADVAASIDLSGNRRNGGDWDLEKHVGSIETSLVLNAQAKSSFEGVLPITVFAAGTTGSENMALQIDGNTVAEWTNVGGNHATDSFAAFNYENDGPVSADRIRVVFTNDLYIENQLDRNLVVDRIVVDGVEFQTESSSVSSNGTWREGVGVQPGNPQSEWLHSGGFFQFSDDARSANHFVTVYAAGQTGTESVELLIDGEVVQQWDNAGGDIVSRNFGTFVYASNEAIDANRVRVQLVDGGFGDGFDHNLVVDKLMIDGTAHEAESDDVISTGTWRLEDGVTTGFRNSEWLHATGFFQFDANTRTYDGVGNNIRFADWGSNHVELLRAADARYADGISDPVQDGLPSAREISNLIVAQIPGSVGNPEALSALVHVWGQFIDHDMDLTEPPVENGEALPIQVPVGDPFFDPFSTGTAVIEMTRSEAAAGTGTNINNPRQHENAISAFIDGSMIYGSTQQQALELRAGSDGRMKVSAGDLLPTDANGDFLAGDIRVMENVNLTAMHTLFVREHNYWAATLQAQFSQMSDEALYQEARKIVMAEVQSITYNEFLPALLGQNAIADYSGYDASVNAGITTEFSTAAYRVGHTMLNDQVEFMDTYGNQNADSLALADAFFDPSILKQLGIDSSLKFAASVQAQTVDTQIVDSLRNFLFGRSGSGGLDLASLNINRGRDHGLADYNTTRQAYGLSRVNDFSDITANVELQNKLRTAYGSVDKIDLWVGGLAEDSPSGSSLGETFTTIIVDQFERTRDGDRLWYENVFTADVINSIEQTSLSDIISRNTNVKTIQDDVFRVWGVIEGRVVSSQNGGSPGQGSPVPGVLVELYDGDGNLVATTRSDSQGGYRFNQMTRTGAYRVLLQLDGTYVSTGTGYQDVWFYEGNLTVDGIDFGLLPNLV